MVGAAYLSPQAHRPAPIRSAKPIERVAHKNIEEFHLEKFQESIRLSTLTLAMSAPSNVSGDLIWEVVRKF